MSEPLKVTFETGANTVVGQAADLFANMHMFFARQADDDTLEMVERIWAAMMEGLGGSE